MDLLLWQISFVIVIFVAVVICSMVPILLARGLIHCSAGMSADDNADTTVSVHFWKQIFGWCDCLTVGGYLSICFLSLLPNIQEQADVVLKHLDFSIEFPVMECAVLLGFFAMLIIDQASKHCHCNSSCVRTNRIVEMDALGILDEIEGSDHFHEDDDTCDVRRTLLASEDSTALPNGSGDQHSFCETDNFEVGSPSAEPASSSNVLSMEQIIGPTDLHSLHGHHCDQAHSTVYQMSKPLLIDSSVLRFDFLLVALGIHALFDGIMLGRQSDISNLFSAVIVHESLVAAMLGFNLARTCHSMWTAIRYSLLFGACIPIGIVLGLSFGQTTGVLGYAISGSVQAFAAGIFLHIAFMQLLPYEFGHANAGHNGLVMTLFLFIGFLMMTTLNLAVGFVH